MKNKPPISPITYDQKNKLSDLRKNIRLWAYQCADGSLASSVGNCPDGDMTIFAGLSCLSGEKNRCENVKNAQSSTGEWFRSPGLVDQYGDGATFSRDQSIGATAYLIETKDTKAAQKWFEFIISNGKKLCKKSKESWNSCSTSFTWWDRARILWDYLDLPKRDDFGKPHRILRYLYNPLEARLQPNDFPLHLTATNIFLIDEMEKRAENKYLLSKSYFKRELHKIRNILIKRSPENPFFRYLKFGPDKISADIVLKYCPNKEPLSKNRDWIWQRSINDSLDGTNFKTWKNPGGHECIFMINLLIGREELN